MTKRRTMDGLAGRPPKRTFSSADIAAGAQGHIIPLNAVDRHVGGRIRSRRTDLQMGEEVLAQSIGVTVDEISDIEAGAVRIGHDALMAAAQALNVPEAYFFEGFGRQH